MGNQRRMFPYPRRRPLRAVLGRLSRWAFGILTDLRIEGRENMPETGPLIVVANHFSFMDPALMVAIARWPMEFLGGFRMPNAPSVVTWLPKVWGYLPVFRGTGARRALMSAEAILERGGVIGIMPEAGSWAQVLRPARPGTAFLAARTGAQILPMGFDGLPSVFPQLGHLRRARVTVRIGRAIGPFEAPGRGRARRKHLERIGREIMEQIAQLIPAEKRGHYSDDPAIRAAAAGTEVFPWDEQPERRR